MRQSRAARLARRVELWAVEVERRALAVLWRLRAIRGLVWRTLWSASARRWIARTVTICAILWTATTPAQSARAGDPPACERCALPGGALQLTPAAARKCLADERTAARVSEALDAARAATAEHQITQGRLAESREQLQTVRADLERAARANALLDARASELARQRWYAAGAGAGATALVGLVLLLTLR